MRKFLLFTCLALVAGVVGLTAQARIDIGFDVPRAAGAFLSDSDYEDFGDALSHYIFPLPSAAIHYTVPAGPCTFGFGMRGYTLVLESVMWPNIFAELNLGDYFVLEAQVGGGAFFVFGLYNSLETGGIVFPEIGAYFKAGKTLRLGAGAMGVIAEDLVSDAVPVIYFFSLKAAIDLGGENRREESGPAKY